MDTDAVTLEWPLTLESLSQEHSSPGKDTEPMIDGDSNPLWNLYETIRTYTDKDGLRLSNYFSEVPSAKEELREETESGLSMLLIQKRLTGGFYDYVSEIAEDFNTLWEDTKKLNEPASELYKYAVELQEVMQNKVQELVGFQYKGLESEDNSEEELLERSEATKPLKERLLSLCKCLLKHTDEDGSHPILQFMQKPSRQTHPDFYERIREPIDMYTIEENVRTNKYGSEEELLKDLKLMFRNYREYYGEESSQFKHSNTLEKVLADRARVLGVTTEEISVIPATAKTDIPGTFIYVTADDTTTSTEPPSKKRRSKEKDKPKRKTINGYILFSSVSRSTVKASNPDMSFGDISRIVGSDWKKLSFDEKCSWEKKADQLNRKNYANFPPQCAQDNVDRKLVSSAATKPEKLLWECQWENCDRVFQSRYDCSEHATGHVSASFNHSKDGEFQCRWNSCARIGKGSAPFPCLQKLVRHVKDVHILKGQCTDPLSDTLKNNNNTKNLNKSDPVMSDDYSEISDPLTRRLYSWCKLLLEIKTTEGRQPMLSLIGKPMTAFLEQTREPANMWAIYRNIAANKYSSEEELLNDFNVMFRNFREQYPDDPCICEDAATLERMLADRAQTLGLRLNERPLISNLVKVEEDSKTQPVQIGISIKPSDEIENVVTKVEPSSLCMSLTSSTDNVECKNVMKLEVPHLSDQHNLLAHDNGTSTSNCNIVSTAMEVDPSSLSWTLSTINTEPVDCKTFIKSEVPSTFNGYSSAVPSNITVAQTPDVANMTMNSSYVLLISTAAPIDGQNFLKVETHDASNVYSSAMSNDVGILGTSNNAVANVIVNSSCNQSFENNSVKVEKIDYSTEDVLVGSNNASIQRVPDPGSASYTAKPQKNAQVQPSRKPFNGYILYSREARKTIAEENPQMSFGEISRTIGAQWMKLSKHEKKVWGDEAARISQEGLERQVEKPSTQGSETPSEQLYWECEWSNCANIFESQRDCLAHATADQIGHVSSWFADPKNWNRTSQYKTYQCEWNNCPRIKKGAPPFPSLHRLVRHVREVHILKNPGRRHLSISGNSEENLKNDSSGYVEISNIIIADSNHLPVKDGSGQEEGIFLLN